MAQQLTGGLMAERWLVIDDSSTIQRVIKLAFQDYDVIISEAENCAEAARDLLRMVPTLVIADAAVAGAQSVQDFVNLRNQASHIPFIVLEGSYDNIDENQFRGAGFEYFLRKPFDAVQLLAVTRQALGRALPLRGPTASVPPPPPGRSRQDEGGALGFQESSYHTATQAPAAGYQPPPPQANFQTHAPQHGTAHQNAQTQALHYQPQPPQQGSPVHYQTQPPQQGSPVQGGQPRNFGRNSGFDLGFHDGNSGHTTVSPVYNSTRPETWPPGSAQEAVQPSMRPVSFSLEDDEDSTSSPSRTSPWDATSRPSVASAQNLLEPMLRENLERWVRSEVEDYCRKHFAGIARELIGRELERLTQERSRLLVDK